jgi:hypothetical protein
MSMNFRFSRDYGECQAVPAIRMCCYSNTYSAEVLLELQRETARRCAQMADDTGGL